jgi:hypothetical protein
LNTTEERYTFHTHDGLDVAFFKSYGVPYKDDAGSYSFAVPEALIAHWRIFKAIARRYAEAIALDLQGGKMFESTLFLLSHVLDTDTEDHKGYKAVEKIVATVKQDASTTQLLAQYGPHFD